MSSGLGLSWGPQGEGAEAAEGVGKKQASAVGGSASQAGEVGWTTGAGIN